MIKSFANLFFLYLFYILSLHSLISESYNILFRQLSICICIDPSVAAVFLMKPDLSFVVNTEVAQLSLNTHSYLLTDVRHLESLFPQVPLIPAVVWFNELLYKMCRCFHALINHQWCWYREQRVHSILPLKQCSQWGFWEGFLEFEQMYEFRLLATFG